MTINRMIMTAIDAGLCVDGHELTNEKRLASLILMKQMWEDRVPADAADKYLFLMAMQCEINRLQDKMITDVLPRL